MRGIRSRAVRGLALGGVVVGCGAAVAASALAAQNHAPTLDASARVTGLPAVTYSHSITLSGREAAGSRRVELQANPFPFTHGFHTIVEVATGRSGKYAFVVKPTHATRYRVRIGTSGATSSPLTVYVLDREVVNSCNLCTAFAGPGTHTLKVREVFSPPPGAIAVKSPGYFYYGQVNGTRSPTAMTLRKSVPVEISHHEESLTVSYRVTFPRGPVQFAYQLCYRDAEAQDGYGLPGRHHCGDPAVERGEYLG